MSIPSVKRHRKALPASRKLRVINDLNSNTAIKTDSLESDLPEELVDMYFFYLDFSFKSFPNMDKARLLSLYDEVFEETFLIERKNNISTWSLPKKTS